MQLKLFYLLLLLVDAYAENLPWIGQARDANWLKHHEQLVNQTITHKSDIKAVFVGASGIEGLLKQGWGLEVWEKYYAPRHAYNYGIGGDRTENLIYRIENGEFDGIDPKVVVISIGSNNIGHNSDDDIERGIKTVIEKFEKKLPNAKIIMIAILPRQGVSADTSVTNINSMSDKLNDDRIVHYFDVGSHFRASLGNVNTTLYRSDHLHINTLGYTLLHDLMESLFSKLLDE